MASDLATALVSGNNAGLLADPSLAAITPQLELAKALTQGGLSTAPAYPMQAAARLAQTLAGVKVAHDAQEDLSNLSQGATGEMGKIFPEGTPLGDGLRSSSPMVRMLAMQQASKAMLLNSENKTLNPAQTIVTPGTPRAPGVPVAAGSPAQAGAVEAAKNAPLIARAGGEAAAKSPYEGGGNITVDTPRGRETIPATAATRAAMQPSVGDITLKTPDGPKTMPITAADRDSLSRGIMPERFKAMGATGIWSPGQQAQAAPQEAPPNASAPIVPKPVATVKAAPPMPSVADRFGPFASVGGEPVKTPEFQGEVTGREKLYGGANEAIGKVIGEHIEAGGKAARDKLGALDTMETALRNGRGIITGPTAESALKLKQLLDGLGLDASWVKQGLPESEIVSKMNAQLASASAKAMTGRPTQIEFMAWQRNNPGLMTSKEGSLALMDVIRQQTRNDIALGKLAMNKGNWDNWGDVSERFAEEHPLINPITGKPMRDELAAAHAPGQGSPTAQGGAMRGEMPIPKQPPVRVSDPSEARKLPKGTPIILPDGSQGVVP